MSIPNRLWSWLAKTVDKTIGYDIVENKKKVEEELDRLILEPENFKRRIPEFQTRYMLKSSFSQEKTNRILVVMTFIILILTFLMWMKSCSTS